MIYGAVASMAFLYSCGGDEETPAPATPTIAVATTVNGTAATSPLNVVPGDEVVFNVSINAEGGFNVYRVFVSKDGGAATKLAEYTRLDLSVDAGVAVVTDSRATEIEAEDVGSTITFEFEVVDDKDQTSTTEIEVVVNSPEARSYSAVLLAAPLGTETANKTSETFFSTNTGLTYSMKTVNQSTEPLSANIDFGYFYGSGSAQTGATLSDPASYPFAYGQSAWGTKNSTTFRRTELNASSFAEVTSFADIDAEFEDAAPADTDPGIESGLVAGQVLAFATDADKAGGSKKGLILIKSITPGDGENGKIELDILVQEDAE